MATKKPASKTTKKTTAIAKKSAAKSTALTKKSAATKAVVKAQPTSKALVAAPVKASDLIATYQAHKNDTGSTTVQIAGVSQQIAELQKHLKKHAKDHDSRRGLLIMVGKRRKLLNYLKRSDAGTYQKLIADLKLRK